MIMKVPAFILLLGLAGLAAARPQVQLDCTSFGDGPQLDCTLQASADGAPLDNARITLAASMPSMPMAHSVTPVAAQPTGRSGEYRGVLQLEMTGAWTVQIDFAAPMRDRLVRSVIVDDCAPRQRCPVAVRSSR